ncbi:fungal-specific transcription factor domain-containing protein [Rhexocercosporidium sp. MPI-PUGE-AT-0058]|nr:fungal-specific transcription factor domain-containing protein [Rhexocercosporidium sp. MPI-PUGE-AT-0058]
MSLASQKLNAKKATEGCWTSRKIGCDKTKPSCNNCVRTKRCCGGYGIKLHWPESADGRRPVHSWDSLPHQQERRQTKVQQKNGHVYFLNTTHEDVKSWMIDAWLHRSKSEFWPAAPSITRSLGFGFEATSNANDKHLLSYYNEVISRMITTIDDRQNGFRTVLLPNALSLQSLASQSLHEGILALSALHLCGRQAAIHHKISSIRFLSQSIQADENLHVSQFGACMMLCLCDVFDAVDGSWYSHMRAADTISHLVITPDTTDSPTAFFLTSWLAYHKILSEFSHIPDQTDSWYIVSKLPDSNPNNQIIIGSLGCSMQVLECISSINHMKKIVEQYPSSVLSPELVSVAKQLETQLESLTQVPRIVHENVSGEVDESRIIHTAELYRIATLIYLYQSVFQKPVGCPEAKLLVEKALLILQKLGICTSPWPLFIIACEITSDRQRILILRTLEKMRKVRRIGNVEIMRNIIEAVWKRADLNTMAHPGMRVNWKDVIDTKRRIPSFI